MELEKEINKIKSERNLIDGAVEDLKQYNEMIASNNTSICPILLISAGETTKEVIYEIRHTLDINWSNAMHLEFLNVSYNEAGEPIIKRFRSQEEYDYEIDTQEKEIDRNEWVESDQCLDEVVSESISRMLEKKTFVDHSVVNVEFIIDSTDENAERYYELFKAFVLKSNHKMYKSIYVLLSQKYASDSVLKSEKILKKILHEDLLNESVYILSDELNDGSRLSQSEQKSNYRLIADLIFLGGDRDNRTFGKRALESGVKLVSYTAFDKPTEQIGEVAVGHLIYKIYASENKRFSSIKLEIEEIKKRLGINSDGSINGVESEWNNLKKKLPTAIQNPIEYFPYIKKGSLNNISRDFKDNIDNVIKELDRQTYGVSTAYIEKYYENSIGTYFEDNNLEEKVYKYIKKQFNYFELFKLKEILNDLKNIIELETPIQVNGKNIIEQFQSYGEKKAKVRFYKKFKRLFCNSLEILISRADNFKRQYDNMCMRITAARSVNGEEDPSIETYYGKQVDSFIYNERNNNSGIIFPEFFDVDNNVHKMLQTIFKIYDRMIRNEDVYAYDFEKELTERMNNLTPMQVTATIDQYFNNSLNRNLRLHCVGQLKPLISVIASYYLLNTRAAYYEYLQGTEDFENEKYHIIQLSRRDSIEQLTIFNIRDKSGISILSTQDDVGMHDKSSLNEDNNKKEKVEKKELSDQEILQNLYDEL